MRGVTILGCGLVAVLCAGSRPAHAAPRTTLADGATGKVEFRTYTPTSQAPLITRAYLSGPPVVVNGRLSLPKAGGALERDGKSPAVILAHGNGGISDEREGAWAKRFNSWGIAAFVGDSFTGRGIKPPIYSDRPGFTHFVAHLFDAYAALQLLGTHPKVDGSRVAIMGFSRGGEVAVNAIFERFREGALGTAPDRFAAYIPLYPYCNFRYKGKAGGRQAVFRPLRVQGRQVRRDQRPAVLDLHGRGRHRGRTRHAHPGQRLAANGGAVTEVPPPESGPRPGHWQPHQTGVQPCLLRRR